LRECWLHTSKVPVESAYAAYMTKRGEDFGVSIGGDIAVDIKKIKARKDAIVKQSYDGVTGWMKGMDNLTVFEGHGRLESANSVSVNGQADKIILKVG
jgi:pyruvate/2-oxoglutarate dehydrogenase complex dihydrolipoamide dehydrogenase (E3) component